MIATEELKTVMEDLIASELTRLGRDADVVVFALYDPDRPNGDPIDFYTVDRRRDEVDPPPAKLTFEGIGVWYFAFRTGKTFRVRKVLLQVAGGRFRHGQVGDFEGYWEDFPSYVAEDRWVQTLLQKARPANDDGNRGTRRLA